MSTGSRLTPAAWLLVNTVAVILAFIGSTLYVSHQTAGIEIMARDIARNADPSIRYLGAARTELHEMARTLTVSVLDDEHGPALRRDLQQHVQRLHDDLEPYATLPFFPGERGHWQLADLDLREVEAQADALLARLEAGDTKGAAELRAGPVADAMQRADVALEGLIAFDADEGSRLGLQIAQERRRAERTAYLLDGLAGLLAVALLAAGAYATRLHLQMLRRAREDVEREVKAREDLLSIVSHDLRNPLSAIGLAASTLQRAIGPSEAPRKKVDLIARNAKRMDRMIADLLTAAKVQEGKLSVEPKAQDTTALVADAVDELAFRAAGSGIDLRFEVASGTPPVYCDAGRIGQVLSNLIGNAVKFTPRGGSILVSAQQGDAGEVRFSVRDTGPGIAEDAVPHVFDRYWQKREHAARGTGLGLFIAKGIVDSHRGRIWVTSHPGQGSDFQFTLPAVETSSEETLVAPSDAAHAASV
jgi:signal transduction histidine kinase